MAKCKNCGIDHTEEDDSYFPGFLRKKRERVFPDNYLAELAKEEKPLEVILTEQIQELTKDFSGTGIAELPEGTKDLTSYKDALLSAQKNCFHENATMLLYNREWVCDDCNKFCDLAEMKRARERRSRGNPFRGFFL